MGFSCTAPQTQFNKFIQQFLRDHFFKFLLLVVFFSCAKSRAQSGEIPHSPQNVNSSTNKKFVSLNHSIGKQQYQVTGSGFTTEVSGSAVSVWGLDSSIEMNERHLIFSYERESVEIKTPEGLRPSEIKAYSDRFTSDYFFRISENSDDDIGIGFFYLGRQVSHVTAPNAVMTSSTRFGPRFTYRSQVEISKNFGYSYGASLASPLWFEELDKSTGSFRNGFHLEGHSHLIYYANEIFHVGLGLLVRYESTKFNYTGDRGTSSAEERVLQVQFPVTLRAHF